LNLGSGPTHLRGRKDIINVDLSHFKEIDIVADVTDLPIENGTVDLVFNIALLEHLSSPQKIMNEMLRVMKPGGEIFCFTPFMQPFHAAPHDFQRWTYYGAKELFAGFEIIETGIGSGPTSGMLWVLQEWLACFFSFGSRTLHDIMLLVIMLLTFPIKFLDIFLVKFPFAEKISSGFYIHARKGLSLQ